MIQETNIRGSEKIEAYKASAARLKILMVGGHVPEDAPNGARGGTAILIPYSIGHSPPEQKRATTRGATQDKVDSG